MASVPKVKPPLPVLTPEQLKANRDALRKRMVSYFEGQRTRASLLLHYLAAACHYSASKHDGWFIQDDGFLNALGVDMDCANSLATELETRGLLEIASTGTTETLQVQTPRSEVKRALDGTVISVQPIRPASATSGQPFTHDRSSSLRRVKLF